MRTLQQVTDVEFVWVHVPWYEFTWHDMGTPGWWVRMKMDYFTNGSVPLFPNIEMMS